jgi:hypothetical protein
MAIPPLASGYYNQVRAGKDRAELQREALEAERKMRAEQDYRRFGLGVAESLVGGAIKLGLGQADQAITDAIYGERKAIGELKGGAAYEYARGLVQGLGIDPGEAGATSLTGAVPPAQKPTIVPPVGARPSTAQRVTTAPAQKAVVDALGIESTPTTAPEKPSSKPRIKVIEDTPDPLSAAARGDAGFPKAKTSTGLPAPSGLDVAADVVADFEVGRKKLYKAPSSITVQGVAEGAVAPSRGIGVTEETEPLPSAEMPSQGSISSPPKRRPVRSQLTSDELERQTAKFRDIALDPTRVAADAAIASRRRPAEPTPQREAAPVARRSVQPASNVTADVNTIETEAPADSAEGRAEVAQKAIGLKPATTKAPGAPATIAPPTPQQIETERKKASATIPMVARRLMAAGPQALPNLPDLTPKQLAELNPQQMQAYYRGKAFVRDYNQAIAALQSKGERERLSMELTRAQIAKAKQGPGIDTKELRQSRESVYGEVQKFNPTVAKTVLNAMQWQEGNSKKLVIQKVLGENARYITPQSAVDYLMSAQGRPPEVQLAMHEWVKGQLTPEAYSRVLKGEHHTIARPMTDDEIREQGIAFDNARLLKQTKPDRGGGRTPAATPGAKPGTTIIGYPFDKERTDRSPDKKNTSPTSSRKGSLTGWINKVSDTAGLYVKPAYQKEFQTLLRKANGFAKQIEAQENPSSELVGAYNSAMNKAWEFTRVKDHSAADLSGVKQEAAEAGKTEAAEKSELKGMAGRISNVQGQMKNRRNELLNAAVGKVSSLTLEDKEIRKYIQHGTKPSEFSDKDWASELEKTKGLGEQRRSYLKAIGSEEAPPTDSKMLDLKGRLDELQGRRKVLKGKYPDIKGASLDPRFKEERDRAIAALTPGQRALFDVIDRRTDLSAAQKAQLFRDLIYGTGTVQVPQRKEYA